MTKKFFKDNRGQVLYAVIVTVMFLGVLSMIAMGLTLQNYHAAQQKQAHIADYYAADAVVELIRIGQIEISETGTETDQDGVKVTLLQSGKENESTTEYEERYQVVCETVTIFVQMKITESDAPETTITRTIVSWEVSYHAAEQTN